MSEDSSKKEELNPKNRDLGAPWLVVLITLVVFALSQFVAAILLSIGLAIFKPDASITDLLDQSAPAQFFYVLLVETVVIALTLLAVKKWRGLSPGFIGFGRWPQVKDFTLAVGGVLVFYGLLVAFSILISFLLPGLDTDEPQEVGFNTLNSSLDSLLAFTALVLLPPIGEETLMRGYLYSGLRARWRFIPAMLVTSVLFGAAHLFTGAVGTTLWIAGINTFVLSIVLVYLREKTGALYAPILLHATNNLVAFTIHFR